VPTKDHARGRPGVGRSLLLSCSYLLAVFLLYGPSAIPHARALATSPLAPSSVAALHVEGNRIVNAAGQPVVLRGVNRMGSEYMCAQGRGIFDGPSDAASIDAIKSWRANAVRVPLNEHCWLGINGVPTEYAGAAYQQAIKDYVDLINAKGLYAIVDLHWSAPGSDLALGPRPMPDLDHSPAFWSQVAGAFAGNEMVIFELFNEPHPDGNQDTEAAWACVRDGGTCPGVPYEVAGTQTLVNLVRATGATNVIAVAGVQYGGTLSRWREYRPADPANKIIAAWHTYNWTWCVAEPCYESNVGAVAAEVPVLATEIGNDQCDAVWMNELLTWLDSSEIGYLAWSWHTFLATECSAIRLILDYGGTPSQYGGAYRSHLMELQRAFAALDADVRITTGPAANDDRLQTTGSFTLGAASEGIDPLTEAVRIEVGAHVIALPPGSFQRDGGGHFFFEDADRTVLFQPLDLERFDYSIEVRSAELTGASGDVRVTLEIGNDRGTTTDQAEMGTP
jgi:endoglucanase